MLISDYIIVERKEYFSPEIVHVVTLAVQLFLPNLRIKSLLNFAGIIGT